jgi:hypothetical protein
MNPYNQQTVNMPDLQNAMLQHEAMKRKQQAANQLAQGGNGWGGIGEILGAALGAYKDNKLSGELDKSHMQISNQMSELQAQQEAEIQRIAQEKAERDRKQKLEALSKVTSAENAAAIVYGGQSLKDLKPDQTTAMQNAAAMGLRPNTPEYNDYIQKATGKVGTSIIMPKNETQSAWDKELAKTDVKMYDTFRNDAVAANGVLNTINQIEPMITAMETGKYQQAKAIAGQFFNTDRATDMQSINAMTGDLVLSELERLKGSSSDTELAKIEQLQASYDKTPAANKRILDYIRSKSEASINRFSEADNYLKQNNNLKGYTPSFGGTTFGAQQAAPQQSRQQVKPPGEMSNEELMQAIMGGN